MNIEQGRGRIYPTRQTLHVAHELFVNGLISGLISLLFATVFLCFFLNMGFTYGFGTHLDMATRTGSEYHIPLAIPLLLVAGWVAGCFIWLYQQWKLFREDLKQTH